MGAVSKLNSQNIKNGLREGKKTLTKAILQLQIALEGIEYRGNFAEAHPLGLIIETLREQAQRLTKFRGKGHE